MRIEGMGRRRPQKDLDLETQQGVDDFKFEQHQRRAADLIELARPIDEADKALTGRKMEDYSHQSGISMSELFPEEGEILNIGDPWQKLDRVGITTLEYETGEEASFISDANYFFDTLPDKINCIKKEIEYLNLSKPEVASSLEWKVNALSEFRIGGGINIDDYPKQAKVAKEIINEIGALVPEVYDRFPDAWYAAVHIARGFSDLYLFEKIIKPKVDAEILKRKGLSEEDETELYRQLVEQYRGQSTYQESTLVKGAYPHTDFDDGSFDRVVASWSISAHMFAVMNKDHFKTTWEETDRLLRKDGAAYFWPVNYYFNDPSELIESLQDYTASGGKAGFVMRSNEGNEVIWINSSDASSIMQYWYDAETLILVGREHSESAISRIEESVSFNNQEQNIAA